VTTSPSSRAGALVVAVLTFRRPDGLRLIVPRLQEQARQLHSVLGMSAEVLVVDNDPDGSAREAVASFERARYVHEPLPGIPAARNRALDEAAGARFIVFIDDDEVPNDGWLTALVQAQRSSGASGVAGAVVPQYDGPVDPWIVAGGFFVRDRWPSGTVVSTAATNNLLLDLDVIREHGLRFDLGFTDTGGSDTVLTRQLTRAGGRIVWCDEAVVTDVVPTQRLTRNWVLRRAFRAGNSDIRAQLRIAHGSRRLVERVRYLGRGALRVVGGSARVVLGTVRRSTTEQAVACRTVFRGLGMLAGAAGHGYEEYRR
jgi:succinoglycan biosynthesis protein ExoM